MTAARAAHPWRLYGVLAALYLAQGVPTYLFAAAIPPILREQGVSRASIGMLSLLALPLVFKFLWAPLVDRISPLARLGQRSGWILLCQGISVLAVASLAFFPPENLLAIFLTGLAVALALATQDVATDGYATLRLSPRQREIGNAIQAGSVALGVLAGGSASLLLYSVAGWQVMMLAAAGVMCLPLLALPFMGEAPVARDAAPRRRPSLRAFFARPGMVGILALALIYRASEGLVKAMEGPYLVDIGLDLDTIGLLSGGSAATAGLIGAAVAALAQRRLGAGGLLITLGCARTLVFALFAAHATGLFGTAAAPAMAAAVAQTLIRYMEIVALYSLFMAACSSDQPGTDFTILASAQLLVYQLGAVLAGQIADAAGYAVLFWLAVAISGLAVSWVVLHLRRRPRAAAPAA
ncbi:MFS transporter [Ferrimonas balearica]|nr:MFS transporter [Ferrimonas balearica]